MNGTSTLVVILTLCMIPFSVFGSDPQGVEVNRRLKKLCKARIDAFVKRDAQKLEELCADDYHILTQSGSKMDLSEITQSFSTPAARISSFTLQSFQSFVVEDGSMAFSVAELLEEFGDQSESISPRSFLVTEVYRKGAGGWKIQLTHVSRKICPPEG